MKLFNQAYTREEIEQRVGDISQLCGMQSMICNDGLEAGTRVLKLWNAGGLQLDIVAERCMDLGRLWVKGIPLTWSSGTGYVHPAYLQDRGWPGGFHGGLLATCGLNNAGPACEDDGERHEQHGRISRIPAAQVTYGADWENGQLLLRAKGIVEDRTSKGYHMRLTRQVIVEGGQNIIRLQDRITNLGLTEEACMIQYHMNFGFPFADRKTELQITDAAREKRLQLSALTHESGVQYIERTDDQTSPGEVILKNAELNMECIIRFSAESLPHLWRWHDFREGMRVFAIEPSNCRVKPRDRAREASCLPTLKPGESMNFDIEIEIRAIF